MTEDEIKALISLIDDEDESIYSHVTNKIKSLGPSVVPLLESYWENSFNPLTQKRLEDVIHDIQLNGLFGRLKHWIEHENNDLLKGIWIINTYLYPELPFLQLKQDLEQIYYQVWLTFNYNMQPFDQIRILNSTFFGKLRFRGNTKNYYAASNSMMNFILESRKSNPIGICVVYMLIAQKLKLPVYGVNLPNLFILIYKGKETDFYINAFNKGLIFSRADIDNYLAQLQTGHRPDFYEPCSNLTIIKRMLANLQLSFKKVGDDERANEINILIKLTEGN